MFKKLSSSFLIVSACIFSSCTPTVKQEIAILPTPVRLTEQTGAIVVSGSRVFAGDSPQCHIGFGGGYDREDSGSYVFAVERDRWQARFL